MRKNLLISCLLILIVPCVVWGAEGSGVTGPDDAETPCQCVNVAYYSACPCYRCPQCGRLHGRARPAEPLAPEAAAAEPPAPEAVAPQVEGAPPTDEAYPPPTSTAAAAPASVAPNMMGDTMGSGCGIVRYGATVIGNVNHPTFGCSRQKIAENNSPMPRNRLYLTYQHFHNANHNMVTEDDQYLDIVDIHDTHVDKCLLGVEKTFLCDNLSVQLQVPFASQLTNDMFQDYGNPPSAPHDYDLQFGNVSVALKALLWRRRCLAISSGLLVETPTAPNVKIHAVEPLDLDPSDPYLDFHLLYRNDSVIVSPFLGMLYTPNSCYFVQGFTQVDIPVSDSSLVFDPTVDGALQPRQEFHFSGQTMMRFDLGAGVWLYRNPCACNLKGLAMLFEAHYSTTLDDADVYVIDTPGVEGGTLQFGNSLNRVDIINLTVGPTLELANGSTIAAGFVLPLDDAPEKPFDFEFQLQVNLFRG